MLADLPTESLVADLMLLVIVKHVFDGELRVHGWSGCAPGWQLGLPRSTL